MKNAWTDEVIIRRTVVLINEKLKNLFVGRPTDMKQFSSFLIQALHANNLSTRVRDAVIWRYNLEAEEKNGTVTTIKLVKLAWIV